MGFMSATAMAAPGDWLVRVGPVNVGPNDDSGELSGVTGAEVSVDSSTSLGISLGYQLNNNLGIGVLGAVPFKHDIQGEGSIEGLDKVAEVEHLPPTVTLQYYFAPEAGIRPFVGAGINYTTFFNEKTTGTLATLTDSIRLDDSWGLALEAGIDIDLNQDWFISGQLWYIDIATKAKLGDGLGSIDVDINPWVVMLSAGHTF
ncbi:MAG: OmpW family outer membrane protein [Gammaproteobacteria bacterium]|nr:OmpW family outer membrane protein [Gammaproteobacteria bacterium]